MARIAIDMDEVIADALGEHIRLYNGHWGKSVQREHILDGYHLRDVVEPEHLATLNDFIDSNFLRESRSDGRRARGSKETDLEARRIHHNGCDGSTAISGY